VPKLQLYGSESDECTPKKGMNMRKANETHDHAVYEKIKVLHYFRFVAEGMIFFLFNFNFTYSLLGKLCRNLV